MRFGQAMPYSINVLRLGQWDYVAVHHWREGGIVCALAPPPALEVALVPRLGEPSGN